jgi:Flp pilus assembly pilin Flp
MWEAVSSGDAGSAVRRILRDESGEGFAEYSAMLSLFTVQCVVGALVVSRNIDHIIEAIRAIF